MKKILIFPLICFLCLRAGGAFLVFASTDNPAGNSGIRTHSIILGAKVHYFDYKEELPPGLKSTESGWLPGICLSYRFTPEDHPFFACSRMDYADAKTKYDGTTQTGMPVIDSTRNHLLLLETDLGLTVSLPDLPFSISCYSGLVYRFWFRGVGMREDIAPLSEEYSWFQVPLGIRPDFYASRYIRLWLDLSVRFMFGGRIRVNLRDMDPGFENASAVLGSSPGWRLETGLAVRLIQGLYLLINPFFEYSAIRMSNTFDIVYNGSMAGRGYEPSSVTLQYGAGLSVEKRF